MIEAVSFRLPHLLYLVPTETQVLDWGLAVKADTYQENWLGITCMSEGVVIGCFGLVPIGEGKYNAWALFSVFSGKCMRAITARVRFALTALNLEVYAYVRTDYGKGHKWAELLGFSRTGCKRETLGIEFLEYVRLKQ